MTDKVRSIRCEPADNGGWSVDTEHERSPSEMKSMGMMDYDSNREHTVHSNMDEAMDHIRMKMEKHEGKSSKVKSDAKNGLVMKGAARAMESRK